MCPSTLVFHDAIMHHSVTMCRRAITYMLPRKFIEPYVMEHPIFHISCLPFALGTTVPFL
jgi:hypothetical protein